MRSKIHAKPDENKFWIMARILDRFGHGASTTLQHQTKPNQTKPNQTYTLLGLAMVGYGWLSYPILGMETPWNYRMELSTCITLSWVVEIGNF